MSCVELAIVVLLVGGEGNGFSRELESSRSCIARGIFGCQVEMFVDGGKASMNIICQACKLRFRH